MIYFAQRETGGPIKIGTSDVVESRRQQLSSNHKAKMKILALMEGSFKEEKKVHRQFAHLSEGHEWFRPEADLLDFIKRVQESCKMARTEVVVRNLLRLGYAEERVRVSEVARMVEQTTGRSFPPGQLSCILNRCRVTPEMIKRIAKAIGVDPEELTQKPKGAE